ncbi:hypothetical protein T492DRAFT_958837 [Pavlovales sp. CCMP2436]|nr:hypothetical protein T492DRAFT_958837 [Pavlovales sp. CCMP2436]
MLCAFMESLFRGPKGLLDDASLHVRSSRTHAEVPAITHTEVALFSPSGRRVSHFSHTLSSDFPVDAKQLLSTKPVSDSYCGSALSLASTAASPSVQNAAESFSNPVLMQGLLLKRNRWNAWQPRWATVSEEGYLSLAANKGEEPTAYIRTSDIRLELTAPPGASEMWISAPSGKKLKIRASEELLVDWAHALGSRRSSSHTAPAA